MLRYPELELETLLCNFYCNSEFYVLLMFFRQNLRTYLSCTLTSMNLLRSTGDLENFIKNTKRIFMRYHLFFLFLFSLKSNFFPTKLLCILFHFDVASSELFLLSSGRPRKYWSRKLKRTNSLIWWPSRQKYSPCARNHTGEKCGLYIFN